MLGVGSDAFHTVGEQLPERTDLLVLWGKAAPPSSFPFELIHQSGPGCRIRQICRNFPARRNDVLFETFAKAETVLDAFHKRVCAEVGVSDRAEEALHNELVVSSV